MRSDRLFFLANQQLRLGAQQERGACFSEISARGQHVKLCGSQRAPCIKQVGERECAATVGELRLISHLCGTWHDVFLKTRGAKRQ